jgi:hypothetical protein
MPARRSPARRIGQGLRRLVADLREAWREPTTPGATPTLRGYPVARS